MFDQNLTIINIANNGAVTKYSKAVALGEIWELQRLESLGNLIGQSGTQVRQISSANWVVVFNFLPLPQPQSVNTEEVPF